MATLTLAVLRCPDYGSTEQRQVQGGELTLGRDPDCDWPLPDPLKSLSRKHCKLEYVAGSWQVRDLSVNGTFVNLATSPIGRDLAQPLRDGDRLRLGDYEIEVRIVEEATLAVTSPPARSLGLGLGHSPIFADAVRPGGLGASRLPGLDDPLELSAMRGQAPSSRGAVPDHVASSSDAYAPPPVVPAGKPIVPDDWYSEAAAAHAPPAAPAETATAPPRAPRATVQLAAAAPAALAASAASAGADSTSADRSSAPTAPAPAAVATGDAFQAAFAAFLAGGDLPPELALRAAADPEAALRNAGALLRAAISGIRALLIARGTVKREFRIEQTILRANENNPLKFAASDEQALTALLDPRKHTLGAMQESINDLTLHQVAVLAATQAAARALLERLEPGTIEAGDSGGGLFSDSLEKRLWAAYKLRHAKLLEQFEDDFESAFGKAFARAYEQAVANVKA